MAKPSFDLVKSIHCSPCPTYRAHRDEIKFLSSLVELIDPSSLVMKADSAPGSLSTANQHYLLDAEAELTGTATFRRGLLFDYVSASVISNSQAAGDKHQSMHPVIIINRSPKQDSPLDFIGHPVIRHRLSAETPLIASVLESLAKFFVQPPALNLILTGCVATLASCPTRSLEGWMLPISSPDDDDDDSFDQSILSSCTPRNPIIDYDEGDDRRPDTGESGADCLLEVYRQLAEQVAGYRRTITNFDKYLKNVVKQILPDNPLTILEIRAFASIRPPRSPEILRSFRPSSKAVVPAAHPSLPHNEQPFTITTTDSETNGSTYKLVFFDRQQWRTKGTIGSRSTKKRSHQSLLKIDFSDDDSENDEDNAGPDTPTKKTLHGTHLPTVKLTRPSSSPSKNSRADRDAILDRPHIDPDTTSSI
ncbi:hypothetical protein Pst134EA_007379 [Puccinia striiformis f. sp. tritici]|uniref:hypothetical protein n=1 Tax=Puccinia striiformis f. sp. tritici TaxID=168172 RepID=UPI00200765D3|nr:hypothetical protein Pst134EA_007379 [Puccinia striiformis f. sp. tritici]KAH9470114.1 hypothetical protein Pst134EA_007379 [Puccinia striiformis f. sp. tritici]